MGTRHVPADRLLTANSTDTTRHDTLASHGRSTRLAPSIPAVLPLLALLSTLISSQLALLLVLLAHPRGCLGVARVRYYRALSAAASLLRRFFAMS